MKWFITYLVGALSGAAALFFFLNMTPQDLVPEPEAAVIFVPAPAAGVPDPVPPVPVIAAPEVVVLPPAVVLPPPAAAMEAAPATSAAPVAAADSPGVGVLPQPDPPVLAIETPLGVRTEAQASSTLLMPVDGIKASQLTDSFSQMRGSERRHNAIDIMAPKGTKVFAVADGKVVKLFNSKQGGLTVYQFDTLEKYAYYYAHLDQYAIGLVDGTLVKRGDLLGYVGSTGNATPTAPHLHFAIFELTPEKQWWKGTPINPYPLLKE